MRPALKKALILGRCGEARATGALPIEFSSILPTEGEYELVVEQHYIPKELKFRGEYYLSIESATAEIEAIRPTIDVEQ